MLVAITLAHVQDGFGRPRCAHVAELPVLQVLSAKHVVADLTLGLGTVVHDYCPWARPRDDTSPDPES